MELTKKTMTMGSILLFALILLITNPDETSHRSAVKSKAYEETQYFGSELTLGKALAMPIFERVVDNYVSRSNFLLFSLTKMQRPNETKIIGIGILGNVFLFKNLKSLQSDQESEIKVAKDEKLSGKQLYEQKCSLCHGDDGKLNLNGSRDIANTKQSEAKIFKIIKNGKNTMPSYDIVLTDEEINEICKYVLTLK